MVKGLYASLGALCKARPKTMWGGMVVFTTMAFLANPIVSNQPGFPWIAAAVFLPVPIVAWAMIRRNRAARLNV